MASGAVIGALRVTLGADTAALETGLKNASAKLNNFAGGLKTFGIAAAAGLAAAATAVGVAVKKSIDDADKLSKLSQSIGIPVEELSRLKYAADLSDVSLEALGKSVGKLSKNMVEAAGNPTSEAARAFEALGISVKNAEGGLKSASEVIAEVSGKFAGYKDGAEKTALAMSLFGKAGAAMIPLLNSGADGLRDMMKEADQLGIVIDTKTAKAAEAFNDNLKRLSTVKEGVITIITARMLPAMKTITDVMVENAKSSTIYAKAADVLTAALKGMVTSGVILMSTFSALGSLISGVAQAITYVVQGKFAEAYSAVAKSGQNITTNAATTWEQVKKIWSDASENLAATSDGTGQKIAAPIIKGTEQAKNAVESFLISTAKRRAAMDAEAQTVGKSVGEQERMRIVLEAETIAKENNIAVTDALRAKITQAADAYAATATRVESARESFNKFQELQQFFGQQLSSVFSDLITGSTKAADAIKKIGRALADAALQAAILGTGPLSGLFGTGNSGGKVGGLTGLLFGGFGGFRAAGGPVSPNMSYVVGENGPEIFTPQKSGQIIPNNAMTGASSGGVQIVQNITFQPGINGTDMAAINAQIAQANQQVLSAIPEIVRQGGRNDPHFYG